MSRTARACFLRAAGLPLHAVVEGSGSPVLVLHGFTGSAESMAGVAAGLRGAHRVVRLDLVGHGRSAAPRGATPYTMQRCVAQVAGALDALGIRRAHLLGYSMGGRVALSLCAARPERVASALLVGASAGIADPAARTRRARRDEALARRIEREGLPAFVDFWMGLPLFASQRRLGREALAAARAQRLRNRAHGLAQSLRGMGAGAQPALHDRLSSIDIPLCLTAGAEDAKFRAIARDLLDRLPRGRLAILPGAGHAAHLESPEAFLRVARRFFAEVDAGQPARPRRPARRARAGRTTPGSAPVPGRTAGRKQTRRRSRREGRRGEGRS